MEGRPLPRITVRAVPSRPRPRHRRLSALVLLASLLAACAGGVDDGDGPRAWRDLDLVVPSGWTVLTERQDLLLIANEDIRIEDGEERELPEDPNTNDVVAVQFAADERTTPDDWRLLVEQEGGEVEADERIEVGGLPATAITYEWASNGVPSRERAVFIPARGIYLLLQPVPLQGQTTGPSVYLRHTEEFDAILDSIEFGRPFEG